jgi:hypothetical protein
VAVLLGAAILHEPLTLRIAGAAAAIVAAVVLIVGGTASPPARKARNGELGTERRVHARTLEGAGWPRRAKASA